MLNERGGAYGSFFELSATAQAIKLVLRTSANWNALPPEVKEFADMNATKLARIVTGNPLHEDSYVDIAGYATLALRAVKGNK